MSLPILCPSCGAASGDGRFCIACGRDLTPDSARFNPAIAIVVALGVYEIGQILLLSEGLRRLGILDGAPTYAHVTAWLQVGVVSWWMLAVLGTAGGLLQSGERRGRLLLAAAVFVVVAQSLDVAAFVIQAVHVTNLVPAGPTSSALTSALATEWLLVIVVSFNLLSFAVAAAAFAGRDWVSRRSRRRRLVSLAFAIWAWAAAIGIAAHFVLLFGTSVAGVARRVTIEETVTAALVLVAAALAAGGFAVASITPPTKAGRSDGLLAGAAIALLGVYVASAVEYFTLGSHVFSGRVKPLYELHAWGSVIFAAAAVGLCAAFAVRRVAASR